MNETTDDETYERICEHVLGAKGTRPVSEIERLRVAVHYCRMRLKRDAYRDTLDAILRGDQDERIRNPDMTPVVLS